MLIIYSFFYYPITVYFGSFYQPLFNYFFLALGYLFTAQALSQY